MDEVIKRASGLIDQILTQSPIALTGDRERTQLNDIRNLLNRLIEPNFPDNEWTGLFKRQLNRLMDSNDLLPISFWFGLHEYILHVVDGPNGEEGTVSWQRFLKRIEFEDKLKQRELHFHKKIPKKKSLHELLCEHKEFYREYLRKCISLHSRLEIPSLVENIDDFCRIYGIAEVLCTSDNKNRLNKKLNSIEINLDCSNRSLQFIDSACFASDNSDKRTNTNSSNFLPSVEQTEKTKCGDLEKIGNGLRDDRWLVILGDPGSAKTSLLRWITRIFAEKVDADSKEVEFEEDGCIHVRIPVRIPILIRIGEFAKWLDQNQTETLMDYIGKHTWYRIRYCHEEGETLLRELIEHGHALILLDGLDEITEVGRRKEIVDLVRKFVDEHVRAPDFISPFDDKLYTGGLFDYEKFVETQSPNKSCGNQIIVTSRFVGYQFSPLTGPFIKHSLLSLMNHKQANEFAKNWTAQVERSVLDILLKEEINVNNSTVQNLWKRRHDAVEAMFISGSELLLSNPSLLSLICTIIFESPDKFCPKSRVEVYNYASQAALRSWINKQSSFSKETLTAVLIGLATYLHLNSPSGLIDEFDTERLCCLVLQQQGLSNNRTKLRQCARELISLLESNIGIVTERGLKTFGFSHLSFQEYFVAESLVKGSSIEDVTKRILTFSINSRFRESILLAMGLISSKWPFKNYDTFCKLLVTTTEDHAIPFGTLLFFDAINDLQTLPSNSTVFKALNNLLDHPSEVIRRKYLLSNLLKLPKDLITEWMNLYMKNDQCFFKFCRCFSMKHNRYSGSIEHARKSMLSVVYQQLWSFHKISSSVEFIIDQTLRRTIVFNPLSENTFNKDLSCYILSNNISMSNIHPLIVSVMIAISGGIYFKNAEEPVEIDFSPKQMHRESSILSSILEYFNNNEQSHLTKVQTLIQQYESVLQKILPTDISLDIVDTFIALICLKGISQPLIYQKYNGYHALTVALNRFKQTWFYLRKLYSSSSFHDMKKSWLRSQLESIMQIFFLKNKESDEECRFFSIACASAWKKLGVWDQINEENISSYRDGEINRFFQDQPEFIHSIIRGDLYEIVQDINSDQILQQKPFILVTILPQSLQKLYYYTIIDPTNPIDSLPLIVLLSTCLIHFDNVHEDDLSSCLALPMLQPLLKKHMLENYALTLFREKYSSSKSLSNNRQIYLLSMEHQKIFDKFLIEESKDYEILINIERQRIFELKNTVENQEKDEQLFAASISLARLLRAHYYKYRQTKQINLSTTENEDVYLATINIRHSILRIIALSIIVDMNDPPIFNEERKDRIRYEMIISLQSIVTNLSLLISTLLFIRCHTSRQFFPVSFRHMANIIGEKLCGLSKNKPTQEQEAVFIALRQLNNPDLLPYLSDFAKRTMNLSNLLHFNSTIFYKYLTTAISFDSPNHILLSSMYLSELAFDTQILNMYTYDDHLNNIQPIKQLKQLWNDSFKDKTTMTYKVATWINNYLQISKKEKEEFQQIIEDVSCCSTIEKKALPVIKKWLDYRMDKVLNIFAYYAALQLVIEDSNMYGLMDIIYEMFRTDRKCRLSSIVQRLFDSQFVDITIIRQILIILHQNVSDFPQFRISIDRKEMFELIFNLELERITSNAHRLIKISTTSYLLMIKNCSKDFQLYLIEHLRIFVNTPSQIENTIKDMYVAVIVKTFMKFLYHEYFPELNCSMELYNYILSLLYDQRFPRVQKAVLNGFNSIFFDIPTENYNFFIEGNARINLEKLINSWNDYSEDILSICLLTYGNYLLMLEQCQVTQNVSDEIKNILNILFENSSSKLISIRAGIGLVLAQHSQIKYNLITKWFSNKSYITPDMRYNLLLQLTLYPVNRMIYSKTANQMRTIADHESVESHEIHDYLKTHSVTLIDTFVTDLYNYLCNKNGHDYFDPTPDYVDIALRFIKTKSNEFHNAVKKSSFGEKEFKTNLCLYCKNNPKNSEPSIELYMTFGILTNELFDMWEQRNDNIGYNFFHNNHLKQISDRSVIEKLFQILNINVYNDKFKDYLDILRFIIHTRDVSLEEVRQWIVSISNVSYYDEHGRRNNEEYIFDLLLDLSCIKNRSLSNTNNELFTEINIHEEYEKELIDLDEKSSLFQRENTFFVDFQPEPNSSN